MACDLRSGSAAFRILALPYAVNMGDDSAFLGLTFSLSGGGCCISVSVGIAHRDSSLITKCRLISARSDHRPSHDISRMRGSVERKLWPVATM